MARSVGDAPFLRRESVAKLIQLNSAELYERYPIQGLFRLGNGGQPRLVPSEKVRIDFEYDNRQEGARHAQPARADLVTLDSAGYKVVSTTYQQYKYKIPPNHAAMLLEPGSTNGMVGEAAAISAIHEAEAERHSAKAIRRMTEKVIRTDEIYAAKLLQGGSFNVTVDGATVSVDTGCTLQNPNATAASWATATTDIPGDLAGTMLEAFIDQAGGPPTHQISSFRLFSDLAANDKIREAAIRHNNGNTALGTFPSWMLPGELGNIQQIVSMMHYKDTAGSKQYIWPTYTLTWLRLEDPEEVLDCIYAATRSNNFGRDGYISNKVWMDDETDDEYLRVRSNSINALLDTNQIMVFDLTSSQ